MCEVRQARPKHSGELCFQCSTCAAAFEEQKGAGKGLSQERGKEKEAAGVRAPETCNSYSVLLNPCSTRPHKYAQQAMQQPAVTETQML
eukprot:1159047-Pelagomonas_calceolata.AAC.1